MDFVHAITPEYEAQIINHDFDDGQEFVKPEIICPIWINFFTFRENTKLQPPILRTGSYDGKDKPEDTYECLSDFIVLEPLR